MALIAAIVIVGRINSRSYYLVCGVDRISAERGRSFPPWGTETLTGDKWRPVAIAEDSECAGGSFRSVEELESAFAAALIAQAERRLSGARPTALDEADAQLNQALVVTRSPHLREERKRVERLRGDVEYWRAASRIAEAIEVLRQAGKQFDEAAAKRPRHQSDAATWGEYARELAEELRLGPPAVRPETPAEPDAPPPFAGTGTGADLATDAGVEAPRERIDAAPGMMLPPVDDTPAAPVDAGLPQGGVLL